MLSVPCSLMTNGSGEESSWAYGQAAKLLCVSHRGAQQRKPEAGRLPASTGCRGQVRWL